MHPLQNAEFVLSVANDDQLPAPAAPELAFAGRSNAGKSSAINALANRTRLAFTSKMPGRTQQINFFRLVSGALIADLPGYGYAAVPQELKRHWQDFLGRYVATRQPLVGLVLIVDARHGISDLDVRLLSSFLSSARPVLVLATKMDKLTASERRAAEAGIVAGIAQTFPQQARQFKVVPFSATRRIGIEAAETTICDWLGLEAPTPEHREREGGGTKEKAPRSRGVPRGPKRPS